MIRRFYTKCRYAPTKSGASATALGNQSYESVCDESDNYELQLLKFDKDVEFTFYNKSTKCKVHDNTILNKFIEDYRHKVVKQINENYKKCETYIYDNNERCICRDAKTKSLYEVNIHINNLDMHLHKKLNELLPDIEERSNYFVETGAHSKFKVSKCILRIDNIESIFKPPEDIPDVFNISCTLLACDADLSKMDDTYHKMLIS